MLSKKSGTCFHGNGGTGASAKECGGVLQSKNLCFSEVTLNPNTEVSKFPIFIREQTRIHVSVLLTFEIFVKNHGWGRQYALLAGLSDISETQN